MTDPQQRRGSPWIVDLRALRLTKRDGPGLAEPLKITAPPPAHTSSPALSIEATGDDAAVTVSGRLESASEGVVVTADVTATAAGSCSRCLDAIEVPLSVTVQELYAYPDSETAATTDSDEIPLVGDDMIDLEPLVHDELVLGMPTIPVCREDCPGLCSGCGARMDSVGPDHGHEIIDPRWAALADMVIDQPAESDPADTSTGPKNPKEK